MSVNQPVIVALDYDSEAEVMSLVSQLSPSQCRLKVGKQLFTALGPTIVEKLQHMGFDIFLDLKFHDIPNTVAKAVLAACELGVWMVNVHAMGGLAMLRAAREAVDGYVKSKPLLIGVTLLTSMAEADLFQMGLTQAPLDYVKRLASLASQAGLDGVVCSAHEAPQLRQQFGDAFVLVTPGIRLDADCQDQKRVMTPQAAIDNGSNYLVMGRSITQAEHPPVILQQINKLFC